MRKDNLKRHHETHKNILSMTDEDVKEEIRARHATQIHREERRQKVEEIAQQEGICINLPNEFEIEDIASLEEELLKTNKEHLEKIELGHQIANILDKGTVLEESLKKMHKEALDLYRKHRPRIDVQFAQLRPWQCELMKMVRQSSDREVIWICGKRGNEGKSWFQSYLETFFGYSRVIRLDLRNKTANILYTLSKRPLQTADIFLFNDTRAVGDTYQNYAVLEHIKDGCATSSKYGSNVIRFKTPNTIVVFSNNTPSTSCLSADRWSVHTIDSDGLRCINKGQNITLQRKDYIEYGNSKFDKNIKVSPW